MTDSLVFALCQDFIPRELVKKIVKRFPDNILVDLSELALNFLIGNLDPYISKEDINLLEKDSESLHYIASSKTNLKQKLRFLLQNIHLLNSFKILAGAEKFGVEQTGENQIIENDG